ncbi:MAG TPA: ABC transporter substrate-binding protein, partial [Candidatus Paceibacterota bacterium]
MKFNKVQIALIVIALAATLVAVLIFAGLIPGLGPSGQKETRQVLMWGTFPSRILQEAFQELERPPKNIEVSYEEKDPATFEAELINALARQAGPDLVIFPAEFILKHKDKLASISSDLISERLFRDTFADGTETLIRPEGIIGLPFLIDPLVLYYNRDLFRNEAVSSPPKTWDEFLVTSQKLTKLDSVGVLARSGAALGLESNVRNFKEILSLLILQTG